MASWCSRLARQPVTLEVDGSSPFEVAKKEKPSIWMAFLFWAVLKSGLEPFKFNTPVGCCWIPAGRNPLLMLCHRHNSIESVRGFHTVRHPFGWLFFFAVLKSGLEPFKFNTPVGCCWIPAGRNPLLMLCHRHNSIVSVRICFAPPTGICKSKELPFFRKRS